MKWGPVIMLLALLSCSKVEDFGNNGVNTGEAGVYGYITPIIFDYDTKASVNPNTLKYNFEIGDRINIWSSTGTLLVYSVESVDENGRASFSGGGFTLTEGETYYSSHPLIRSIQDDYKTLTTSYVGQTQTANNDANHMANYIYTYSSATCTDGNTSFQYHHLSCFLKFVVTLPSEGLTIKELTLSADSDVFALNGTVDITTATFTPGDMSDVLTLALDDVVVSGNVLTASFAAAPFPEGNYVVRVKDSEDNVYTSGFVSKNAVAAGYGSLFTVEVFAGEEPPVVAQIGDVSYSSLADAINAVPTDGTATTIKMVDDENLGTEGLVIGENQVVTIALGNYSITGAVNGKLITNNGNLTFTGSNGTVCNTDVSAQGHDAVYNAAGATLTIKGGHFGDSDTDKTNANSINRGAAVRNFGTATISGGTFTACDNFTNGGFAYAIINDGDGDLTFTGGTVYGCNNGNFAVNDGTVLIKAGSFTVSGTKSYNCVYNYDGEVTITGGNFRKENHSAQGAQQKMILRRDFDTEATGTFSVSAGTFYGGAIEESYIATGCQQMVFENAGETVHQVVPVVGVQQASDIKMGSPGIYDIQADIDYNSNFAGGIFASGYLEFDLNNHSITTHRSKSPAFNIRGSQKAVFNGPGSITCATEDNAAIWANGSDVEITINGGDWSANADGSECIYCYQGKITINGGTFRLIGSENPDTTFLLNCYDQNRAAGNAWITVKGGTFWDFNPADNAAEGEHTNFVASGYHVVADSIAQPGHTLYTVVAD